MTALEKFIKQIVLKQVKGSVYLVPAICDFQITEALEEEENNRRELLIAFITKLCPNDDQDDNESYVDEFIKSNL